MPTPRRTLLRPLVDELIVIADGARKGMVLPLTEKLTQFLDSEKNRMGAVGDTESKTP